CASVLPCGVRTFLEPLTRPAVTRPATWIVAPVRARPRSRAGCRTPGRRRSRRGRASRTRRRQDTRVTRPGGARRAPGRGSGEAERPSTSELPEDSHDAAEDLDVVGVDR